MLAGGSTLKNMLRHSKTWKPKSTLIFFLLTLIFFLVGGGRVENALVMYNIKRLGGPLSGHEMFSRRRGKDAVFGWRLQNHDIFIRPTGHLVKLRLPAVRFCLVRTISPRNRRWSAACSTKGSSTALCWFPWLPLGARLSQSLKFNTEPVACDWKSPFFQLFFHKSLRSPSLMFFFCLALMCRITFTD